MEQIVTIPVPQIIDESVEEIQLVPKEQIREHIVGDIVVIVPQVMEETIETANIIPQKRVL